jgi:hypothetical protein
MISDAHQPPVSPSLFVSPVRTSVPIGAGMEFPVDTTVASSKIPVKKQLSFEEHTVGLDPRERDGGVRIPILF